MDEPKTSSPIALRRAVEPRAAPCSEVVTTCCARQAHTRCTLAALHRHGLSKGHQVGPACWASAQCATVAMGCNVAHVNSELFAFSLGLFRWNSNQIRFEFGFIQILFKLDE
jgi:hypothetical protein